MQGSPITVTVHADERALSEDAADRVTAAAHAAVAARGRFVLALAGGSTPRALHAALVARGVDALPWARTWILFGDERCVPPDDPASNFAMAHATLLAHVPVPEAQRLRMEGEREPEDAAVRYEALLRGLAERVQPGAADDAAVPLVDVLLLGVGADGHTASLFPGAPTLAERTRWVVPAEAPPDAVSRRRLTLTLPALARARTVLVLAAGAGKRAAIADALRPARALTASDADDALPIARVRGHEATVWLLDAAAAPASALP